MPLQLTKEDVRRIIREELSDLIKTERYTFAKHLQLLDGRDITLGTATGTTIGTETTQKLAFYGKAGVARQAAVSDAPARTGTYNQTEAQQTSDAVNFLIDRLQAYGLLP